MYSADLKYPLACHNICKTFSVKKQALPVVSNFSYQFENGKLYVIKGSSGCGKTTLLTILALLQSCDSGSVSIFGERVDDLPEQKKQKLLLNHIGIVFQDSNLLSGLTVYDNIILASVCEKSIAGNEVGPRAEQLMDLLDIRHIRASYPMQISGGERQRAGIARAIMNNPDILICDEPISNLDEENSNTIIHFLADYCHREQKLVIVTCHSSAFDEYADGIIKMEGVRK